MRIRRRWLVVAVLLVPATAGAHDHTADFFGGPTFGGGSRLIGVQQTLAVTSPKPDSHDMSILGDLSVDFGSHEGNDVKRVAVMGGVRLTKPGAPDTFKNRFFAQALAGVVRRHQGAQDSTDPALAIGAGYELLPKGDKTAAGWSARAQFDYVKVFKGGESYPRASVGAVYRIKKGTP